MPFLRFTAFTLIGCIPWVLLLGFVGNQVGGNWPRWRHSLGYVDDACAVLLAGTVIYLLVRAFTRRRAERHFDLG